MCADQAATDFRPDEEEQREEAAIDREAEPIGRELSSLNDVERWEAR